METTSKRVKKESRYIRLDDVFSTEPSITIEEHEAISKIKFNPLKREFKNINRLETLHA